MIGNWAAGSLAIGLGVIPLVGGLAALFRAPGEMPSRELRDVPVRLRSPAIVSVGMYTGMKAAYLSTVFATRVEERNIIYVAPLLLVGTALRPRAAARELLGARSERRPTPRYLVGYAATTRRRSREMGVQLYSDALGLSILQQANRYLCWTPTTAQWVLLVDPRRRVSSGSWRCRPLRSARASRASSRPSSRSGSSGWNLTGEISAAAGTNSISRTRGGDAPPSVHVGRRRSRSGSRRSTSARVRPTRTRSGCSSSGTARSSPSAASTARVDGPGPAGAPNLTAERRRSYWTADPANPGPQYAYARRGLAVRRLRGHVPRHALSARPAAASRPGG